MCLAYSGSKFRISCMIYYLEQCTIGKRIEKLYMGCKYYRKAIYCLSQRSIKELMVPHLEREKTKRSNLSFLPFPVAAYPLNKSLLVQS